MIGNSEAGVAAYGLRRPRVFVVHNGFEIERTPRDSGRPMRLEDARAEIVMAARMVREKDFDTLVDAAEAMREPRAASS